MIIYIVICFICIYSLYQTRKDDINENYKYGIILLLVLQLFSILGSLGNSPIPISDFLNYLTYNIGANFLGIIALILSIRILNKHNKNTNNDNIDKS